MKKKTSLFLAIFFIFLLVAHNALAVVELLDGRIRLRGRLEQYLVMLTNLPSGDHFYRRADRLDVNQSIFALEGLTKLVANGEWLVNLQSYIRYYYDSAPDLDHRLQRSFDRRVRYRKYQRNAMDEDDWINEFYLDIYKGPWNVRLGKQIVVWSEVQMVQTIDKINPLDLRFATPGMQPFDELKLSLWMFRGFYNSSLPGNLIFEHIFIPGDHEHTRNPFGYEGSFMARKAAPGRVPKNHGMGAAIYWMYEDGKPSFSLKNYQYAFRIRGNSEVWLFKIPYVLDWTLSYVNVLDNGHAVFEKTEIVNEYLDSRAQIRVSGLIPPPLLRGVAKWKRYEAVGASCQSYIPKLGGVLRGELAYEIGRKWNSVDPKNPRTARRVGEVGLFDRRTVERDQFNYGITIDKPICLTQYYGDWMQKWGLRPCVDITLGVFGGYFMQNKSRVWQWSQGYDYRSRTFFTFMARWGFLHNTFIPVLRASFNPRNFGFIAPTVVYMPGSHFRLNVGYLYFYAKNPEAHREAAVEDRDAVWVRIRYEF